VPLLVIGPSPAPFVAPVPTTARRLTDSLYRVDLEGRQPLLVTSAPGRIWFVDQRNTLNVLDASSGKALTIDSFPADADIVALATGTRSVYAIDARTSRLYSLDFDRERLVSKHVSLISSATAIVVGPDGRLWMGMTGSGQILVHDPLTGRTETIPTGLSAVKALALDEDGRLWFTDGERLAATYDPGSRRMALFVVPGTGSAQHLLPDAAGRVWVGSSTGEISAIEAGTGRLVLNVRRPIASMALGPSGDAWFLAPAAPGLTGFIYGRVDGSDINTIPGAATSLAFSSAGRAWIADPTGGFYLGVEASR
jgi:ligand-binding sensor domain-containing protein